MITYFGVTNWRNQRHFFGIKDQDRLSHIYAIGKTGTGKTTLLMNMALSDIERGNGLCIVDPHGDLAESLLDYIPSNRIADVIYFNSTDTEFPVGFNPLDDVPPKNHNLVTAGLISTFKKVWSETWGPRLEHILRFCLLSLLHKPASTLLDIQLLLTNQVFRSTVLSNVTDVSLLRFWYNEFDKYPLPFKSEAIAPILNKLGLLNASSNLRNIIGQRKSSLDIQNIIETGKILICNFSKGQIGDDSSALLGSMLLTAIQKAAMFRASYHPSERRPFYLYVDEIHSFITLSFADILAESRKYGLSVFLTHQYIEQLHEKIRSAIFGNVGTIISFRIGASDAEFLAKEFHPVFSQDDFVNLPQYSMYLKLMIDGATSKPFSAFTLPLTIPNNSYRQTIIQRSQKGFGKSRIDVEKLINNRFSEINFQAPQEKLF